MEQFYKKYLLKNIARMLYFLFVPNVFYVYWNSMENFELSDFFGKVEKLWGLVVGASAVSDTEVSTQPEANPNTLIKFL